MPQALADPIRLWLTAGCCLPEREPGLAESACGLPSSEARPDARVAASRRFLPVRGAVPRAAPCSLRRFRAFSSCMVHVLPPPRDSQSGYLQKELGHNAGLAARAAPPQLASAQARLETMRPGT